jgi:hypothetical protein
LIRALALACFALVAACGDDTTAVTVPADMSVCLFSGCCEGFACAGGACTGFEYHCVCGADGKWACTPFNPNPKDMVQPAFD